MLVASSIEHNGIPFTGVRHSNIITYMRKLGIAYEGIDKQGFITDTGEHLCRDEALDHAIDCGQIKFTDEGNYDIIGGVLTSEDLW